jgi:hypothetical protein
MCRKCSDFTVLCKITVTEKFHTLDLVLEDFVYVSMELG